VKRRIPSAASPQTPAEGQNRIFRPNWIRRLGRCPGRIPALPYPPPR
jgi:hypothetical protein